MPHRRGARQGHKQKVFTRILSISRIALKDFYHANDTIERITRQLFYTNKRHFFSSFFRAEDPPRKTAFRTPFFGGKKERRWGCHVQEKRSETIIPKGKRPERDRDRRSFKGSDAIDRADRTGDLGTSCLFIRREGGRNGGEHDFRHVLRAILRKG